jgi:hypothetical protein
MLSGTRDFLSQMNARMRELAESDWENFRMWAVARHSSSQPDSLDKLISSAAVTAPRMTAGKTGLSAFSSAVFEHPPRAEFVMF